MIRFPGGAEAAEALGLDKAQGPVKGQGRHPPPGRAWIYVSERERARPRRPEAAVLDLALLGAFILVLNNCLVVDLNPDLASILRVPVPATEQEIADRLAAAVGAPSPAGEEAVPLWVTLALNIQENLIENHPEVMDDAEAAHYPQSATFVGLSPEESDAWGRALGGLSSDEIGGFLQDEVVPKLADAGYFRLVGRR